MKIRLIRSPTEDFRQMLLNNVKPTERKHLEGIQWGAVGLIQAKLIDLYWAGDTAEKAGDVKTALVMGNCPQHIQMLAVCGRQGPVQTALDKIREQWSD